jgi:hypothetical protein
MAGIGILELLIVIYIILWIVALIDILRSKFIKLRYTFLWLLVIFLIPLGAILYFIFCHKFKLTIWSNR